MGIDGSLKNNYGFQGAFSELDEDLGWNGFALRSYDPQIGRFIQMDPYDQFASGYVGMGDNPVNSIDPSGGIDVELLAPTQNVNVIGSLAKVGAKARAAKALQRLVSAGAKITLEQIRSMATRDNSAHSDNYGERSMLTQKAQAGEIQRQQQAFANRPAFSQWDGVHRTNFWGKMKRLGEITGPVTGISAVYGTIDNAHTFLGSRYDLTGQSVSENGRMMAVIGTLSLPLSAIGGGGAAGEEMMTLYRGTNYYDALRLMLIKHLTQVK